MPVTLICEPWVFRRSASTWKTTAAPSCWSASSMTNYPGTLRRLSGSAGDLGKDAYPSLDAWAAALLHSLARNHALIDGDTRLALAAVIAFCGLNGRRLTLTNDQAEEIVAILQAATAPRR